MCGFALDRSHTFRSKNLRLRLQPARVRHNRTIRYGGAAMAALFQAAVPWCVL